MFSTNSVSLTLVCLVLIIAVSNGSFDESNAHDMAHAKSFGFIICGKLAAEKHANEPLGFLGRFQGAKCQFKERPMMFEKQYLRFMAFAETEWRWYPIVGWAVPYTHQVKANRDEGYGDGSSCRTQKARREPRPPGEKRVATHATTELKKRLLLGHEQDFFP